MIWNTGPLAFEFSLVINLKDAGYLQMAYSTAFCRHLVHNVKIDDFNKIQINIRKI